MCTVQYPVIVMNRKTCRTPSRIRGMTLRAIRGIIALLVIRIAAIVVIFYVTCIAIGWRIVVIAIVAFGTFYACMCSVQYPIIVMYWETCGTPSRIRSMTLCAISGIIACLMVWITAIVVIFYVACITIGRCTCVTISMTIIAIDVFMCTGKFPIAIMIKCRGFPCISCMTSSAIGRKSCFRMIWIRATIVILYMTSLAFCRSTRIPICMTLIAISIHMRSRQFPIFIMHIKISRTPSRSRCMALNTIC